MSRSTNRSRNDNNNQKVLGTKIPELESEDDDVLVEQLNFEIECPRCSDVMQLFSEFDHLSYYCESCQLELDIH